MSSGKEIDLVHLLINQLNFRFGECEGKTIVVTGAGQGIGLQVARSFSLLGGNVIIAEINEETGKQAASLVRGSGGHALFIKTDVSNSHEVANLSRRVHQAFGRVDILVNNAIRCPVVPVVEMDEAVWDGVIAVNLRGTFLTTKAFLPDMLSRHTGVIVNLVSLDAMPGLSAYIASKQAITGFSQSLALETANSGVSIIPFGPGMVDTPGIRDVAERLAPQLGMSRDEFLGLSLHVGYESLMPAEHAAAALVFLTLRLASEYHGQSITGYDILERAGVLTPAGSSAPATTKAEPAPVQQSSLPGETDDLLESLDRVVAILYETGKEFEKLPIFVRPMARSGFKNKSGWSLEEWHRAIDKTHKEITTAGQEQPGGKLTDLSSRLDLLCEYYRGVPAETARFTRDADLLRQIAATCEERVRTIQELKGRLLHQVG